MRGYSMIAKRRTRAGTLYQSSLTGKPIKEWAWASLLKKMELLFRERPPILLMLAGLRLKLIQKRNTGERGLLL